MWETTYPLFFFEKKEVNMPELNNNQGILIGDIFVNNKEIFVDFFEQYYTLNKIQIDEVANRLHKILKEYGVKNVTYKMAADFENAWEQFEQIVLLNHQKLQLLVAYRGAGGKDARFSAIVDQSAVMGTEDTNWAKNQYGIRSGHKLIEDSMAALEASEVEQYLQKHLNGLLAQLDTSINRDEAQLLHRYHNHCLSSYFQENDEAHLTNVLFRNAFYAKNQDKDSSDSFYYGGRGLGRVYDAFMNHMAEHEKAVFDYLASHGAGAAPGVQKFGENSKTVYREEGEVYQGAHFPTLMKESTNRVAWYTGGDIIIVNPKTMSVVYNIQLKTTTEKTKSVFSESVADLGKFIEIFVNASPREKGETLFHYLLTSVSNATEFNSMPKETQNQILKDSLSKYLGKTFEVNILDK